MTITKTITDSTATISLEGRLDTTTAPELDSVLTELIPALTDLVFDFTQLVYISSSGLRVLLSAQKKMNKKGTMVLTGVNDIVMEIFEVTGFSNILTFG